MLPVGSLPPPTLCRAAPKDRDAILLVRQPPFLPSQLDILRISIIIRGTHSRGRTALSNGGRQYPRVAAFFQRPVRLYPEGVEQDTAGGGGGGDGRRHRRPGRCTPPPHPWVGRREESPRRGRNREGGFPHYHLRLKHPRPRRDRRRRRRQAGARRQTLRSTGGWGPRGAHDSAPEPVPDCLAVHVAVILEVRQLVKRLVLV